mmetsp:Transcript_12370/g.51994  ORF Transcript_12370/g.51994 Transcript_12370/m.51994 type:complete len:236 (+) Transcript_12370:86-793(+)
MGQEQLRRRGRHLRRGPRPQDAAVLPDRRAPRADQAHGTKGGQAADGRRSPRRLRPRGPRREEEEADDDGEHRGGHQGAGKGDHLRGGPPRGGAGGCDHGELLARAHQPRQHLLHERNDPVPVRCARAPIHPQRCVRRGRRHARVRARARRRHRARQRHPRSLQRDQKLQRGGDAVSIPRAPAPAVPAVRAGWAGRRVLAAGRGGVLELHPTDALPRGSRRRQTLRPPTEDVAQE